MYTQEKLLTIMWSVIKILTNLIKANKSSRKCANTKLECDEALKLSTFKKNDAANIIKNNAELCETSINKIVKLITMFKSVKFNSLIDWDTINSAVALKFIVELAA